RGVTQGGNLMAQALDPGTLKLSGEAALVAQDVGGSESNGYIDLSASRTGVLAYGTVTQASRRLVWLDRDGNRREAVSDAGLWYFARVSPDGGSLAVLHYEAVRTDVWLIGSRDARQKFTFSGDVLGGPVWSPDGREIVYAVSGKGLFRKAANGAGEPVLLLSNTAPVIAPRDWSDDGKF